MRTQDMKHMATMRIVDLGGGTAYEYIGDSDREYQQLLDLVRTTYESGGLVEDDLVPIFNKRSTLWACSPYTKERLKEKEHVIRVYRPQPTGYFDYDETTKEWVRDTKNVLTKVIR